MVSALLPDPPWIPSELIEFRSSLRSFIEREVEPREEPHRAEIGETYGFPGIEEEHARIRHRSAELGFWSAHMPEEVGGGGLSILGQVLLFEEAHRHGLILAQFEGVLPVVMGPTPVYLDCTQDQRERYLKPLMTAERLTCFALTEPEAGSDATRIRTRAERKGDRWVINGRKHFITHGDLADLALVFALTDPEKRARGGITAFLVDRGTPGFTVTRLQRTMSPYDHPVELTFEDVEVGDDQVLGEVGHGFYSAMKGINGARLHIAGAALGYARNFLERSLAYAGDRVAFERPIGSYQYVQGMVVDSFAELEQARLLVYECARRIDAGADGRTEAALAKLVATEMVGRVADRAIQVHGGTGFMSEVGLEGFARTVRAMRLYEGTSEILRTNVAKGLGLPG